MSKKFQGPTGSLMTCDALSRAFVAEEIRRTFPAAPALIWLKTYEANEDGIAIVEPGVSFAEFAAHVNSIGLFFLRHIAPVQQRVALTGAEADIETLCTAAEDLAHLLNPTGTFSVQSRVLAHGPLPYRKVAINETLSLRLEASTGATMNTREPEQVVTVLCTPTTGYVGVSHTSQNLSAWPGGKHRFKREEGQISRSEFKLLEALSVFNISLPNEGMALDIGAAPGGWTRVLRAAGLSVVALDPAELDERLAGVSGVAHVQKRIQDYLADGSRNRAAPFRVIVNDLKMDARGSVEIMQRVRPRMALGGFGIMTLKLPRSIRSTATMLAFLRSDIERLRRGYAVLGARQLYHNRSEITVVLQRER